MRIENKAPDLSIVIPTKNEEERLPRTLARLRETLAEGDLDTEVILADDASHDQTKHVWQKFTPDLDIHFLEGHDSKGVGSAIRRGVAKARGDNILICDADGAVPFDEVANLIATLQQGFEIAAGSRYIQGSKILVAQPWQRQVMGRLWRFLVGCIAPTGVKDTQCGFKLYARATAQHTFARTRSQSFGIRVEALWLAKMAGSKIKEVPVQWEDITGSKIKVWQDSLRMFADLILVRWRQHPMHYQMRTGKISHPS